MDDQNVRWTKSELLAWLNDGQRSIARYIPEVGIEENRTFDPKSGTGQDLPEDCISLIDVYYSTQAGQKRGMRRGDPDIMDALFPTWRSNIAVDYTRPGTWFYDEKHPKRFWVYPGIPSEGFPTIAILYRKAPNNVGANGNIGIDDIYADSLIDYILYRAYMKEEEEVAIDQTKAVFHYNAYLTGLGQKVEGDMMLEAKQ